MFIGFADPDFEKASSFLSVILSIRQSFSCCRFLLSVTLCCLEVEKRDLQEKPTRTSQAFCSFYLLLIDFHVELVNLFNFLPCLFSLILMQNLSVKNIFL